MTVKRFQEGQSHFSAGRRVVDEKYRAQTALFSKNARYLANLVEEYKGQECAALALDVLLGNSKKGELAKFSPGSYANPFNSVTRICFYLLEDKVPVIVYNYLDQRVRTLWQGKKECGRHEIVWNDVNEAGDLTGSGIYFCRIIVGDKIHPLKLMMVR